MNYVNTTQHTKQECVTTKWRLDHVIQKTVHMHILIKKEIRMQSVDLFVTLTYIFLKVNSLLNYRIFKIKAIEV